MSDMTDGRAAESGHVRECPRGEGRMSWTPDLYIGELRPWPDAVHVRRGWKELRRYVPELTCHEIEDEDTGFIICSECGAVHDEDYTSYHCWCCGAKVVDE